ncbi:MAG: hypothetical protein AAF465_14080 [Pseudomonadota bacterium]
MRSNWVRLTSLLCLTGILAACGNSPPQRMDVNSDIPTPVISKIPVSAGVVFNEQLTSFTTTERQQNGKKWQIGLGNTNRKILSNIFDSLFEEVVEFPNAKAAAESTDIAFTLVPRIDDYSMLSAGDAGGKFYAVSMRHFIDIYATAGKRVGTMEVNSYGRQRKAGVMSGGVAEIDAATDDAFRDLAVTLVVELPNQLNQAGLTGAPEDDILDDMDDSDTDADMGSAE